MEWKVKCRILEWHVLQYDQRYIFLKMKL
jgi:hypothetical protein